MAKISSNSAATFHRQTNIFDKHDLMHDCFTVSQCDTMKYNVTNLRWKAFSVVSFAYHKYWENKGIMENWYTEADKLQIRSVSSSIKGSRTGTRNLEISGFLEPRRRISLSRFLAECRKRRLNQGSFVLLCFTVFALSIFLYCFVCQYQSSDWLWRPLPNQLKDFCNKWVFNLIIIGINYR